MPSSRLAAVAIAVLLPFTAGGCGHPGWRPSLAAYESLPRPAGPPARQGPGARFFGASTIAVSSGSSHILIDGFFSRPAAWRFALPLRPNEGAITARLAEVGPGTISGVFVAHSHYDHALDSAKVAIDTGAELYGSASTAIIADEDGLPSEQITVIVPGAVYQADPFEVTPLLIPHAAGGRYPGEISTAFRSPTWLSNYREGANYSFLVEHDEVTILIVPSAGLGGSRMSSVRADVVFLSLGLLGLNSEECAEAYWRETVLNTGASLVIPVHWDDFSQPLNDPLAASPYILDRIDLAMERIARRGIRDGIAVRLPRPTEWIDLSFLPPRRNGPHRTVDVAACSG